MMATSRNRLRTWLAAVALATAVLPSLASAQSRLSLAERVGRLEAQAQQAQGGVGVVNQVQMLQRQIQELQGQVEQLRHELQQLQQSNKDQYLDLDSRLARLEGGAATVIGGSANSNGNGPEQLPDVQLGASALPNDGPVAPNESSTDMGAMPPSPADAQADYDRAFDELRSGDFPAASRLFAAFIQRYPQSDLAPNAYYWLGESYYATQNYPIALDTFQNLLQRFPASSKAAGALLKVGYSHYEMQQWEAASDALNQVIQRYPGSTEARMAEGRLRALRVHANR